MSKEKHIYVIGMDDFNMREIEELARQPGYGHCRFHALLSYDDLGQTDAVSFNDLLDKARGILKSADTPIDAIMTFWDFPAQTMAPLLCREFGLACNTDVNEIEKCEHKYWARVLQQEAVPEATPAFAAVDPFSGDDLPDLDFPFWLKPVKSFSSYLAFKIGSEQEYREALEKICADIDTVATPYNELLEHLDLPEDIARVDGCWCIAEAIIKGEQCTVEGYCYEGKVHVHGIIDSVVEKDSSSFARYQYPSHLPREVQDRMVELSERLMEGLGYDLSAFNIEFFWHRETGDLKILEVNPRISQSHAELFKKVDGLTNEAIPVALALGEKPDFPYRKGDHAVAAKFYLRAHEDAYVEQVPGEDNIESIHQRYPDVEVKIQAHEGGHLSDDKLQDSYSFELAQLFMGAGEEGELLAKYRECVELMEFRLRETGEDLSRLTSEAHQPPVDRQSA